MFRYRLYTPDGDEIGEATYAQMIHAGEEIIADESSFVGMLKVFPETAI